MDYAPPAHGDKTIAEQLHAGATTVAAVAGGPVGIVLYMLRHLPTLRWHQVPRLIMWLVAGWVVLSVCGNQLRAVWSEWSVQERHTEWALRMDAECRAMSDFAKSAPGTSRDCDNATTTIQTASLSRALDKVAERWPQPDDLLARLSDTIEKKFYLACVMGALFSLFWMAGGRRLVDYGRDQLHERQHKLGAAELQNIVTMATLTGQMVAMQKQQQQQQQRTGKTYAATRPGA